MTRVIKLFWDGLVYGSVTTVLMLAIFAAIAWYRFDLNKEKSFRLFAVLYNVDVAAMEARNLSAAARGADERASYDDVLKERAMATLDQDLRDQAINKGLADLRLLQRDLMEERRRYDLLKTSFDTELQRLRSTATNNAIIELQQTLESIKSSQAKDHIVRMLPSDFRNGRFTELSDEDRAAVIDVVTILKAMPLDKRKKLLGEFQTDEESQILAELLKLIRLGVPEAKLIDDTRGQLQEFNAN
ncbi:MAG: hypothetical protein KDA41_17975 [Planctomycetales bacterium]|nr:hypothetical protein [Planctomycetales bacterium]